VLLGCYRAFRRLLRALGSEDAFFRQDSLRLTWLAEGGALLRLRPPRWPAPLHLAGGFLGLQALSLSERLELCAAGLLPFLPRPAAGETVAAWLRRQGHGGIARQLMFEPLCLAVMNEAPERADARLFARTLREAFSGGRGHSAIWVPRWPWGQILDRPAQALARRERVALLLGHRVAALLPSSATPTLQLASGEQLAGHDRVLLALPWKGAAALDPGGIICPGAGSIAAAPMVNVYLMLPPGTLKFPDPVVALVAGHPFHFLCRRVDAAGQANPELPAALLAGGAWHLDGWPRQAIVAAGLDQLARHLGRAEPWPATVAATARVVREAQATLAPDPGTVLLRPKPGPTRVPGLWLAGDWTDTGLPSTLEGAARSAFDPLDA
jgi:hypothetical protein